MFGVGRIPQGEFHTMHCEGPSEGKVSLCNRFLTKTGTPKQSDISKEFDVFRPKRRSSLKIFVVRPNNVEMQDGL